MSKVRVVPPRPSYTQSTRRRSKVHLLCCDALENPKPIYCHSHRCRHAPDNCGGYRSLRPYFFTRRNLRSDSHLSRVSLRASNRSLSEFNTQQAPIHEVGAWVTDAARSAPNNSTLGFVLEEALLLVLLEMFGGKECALSDAFDTDQPWGSRKVTLVSLKRRIDGKMQSCPVSWTSGSSDRLGFKATSPSQVIEFLNNPDGKCFLFPDTHMGPDLSWFFQDWETKELMLANAQGKLSETLAPAKWQRALQTVDPKFFYMVKVCPEHSFLCHCSSPILNDRRGKKGGRCNMPRQSTLIFWMMSWMPWM